MLIMANKYKNMLNNLVNRLDDGLKIEVSPKLRQIHILSNNISGPRKENRALNSERDILKTQSQDYQQGYDTFLSFLGAQLDRPKKISQKKIREKECKRNRGKYHERQRGDKILEMCSLLYDS